MTDGLESIIPTTRSSYRMRLKRHFGAEINTSWTDLPLLICCFKTGLLDAAVFNVWSCFVSMQTGNTLYVGLGVTGQPKDQPYRWIKSSVAIIAFLVGSFLFSRLQRALGPTTRTSMAVSNTIQMLLTVLAAGLVSLRIVPFDAGHILPENLIVLAPIVLLSMQSAGQMVSSRMLGFPELTTVVLTSAYADLAMDEKVFEGPARNVKRNRRAASMIMMFAGAVVGGFLTKGGDIGFALWVAAGIKAFILALWVGWKAESGAIQLD